MKNKRIDSTSPISMSLTITRKKNKFIIECDSPISTENVRIRYGFRKNTFKITDEGFVSIDIAKNLIETVREIDDTVSKWFHDTYIDSVLDNVQISKNAIKTMFRPSVTDTQMRLHVSPSRCQFFNGDDTRIENVDCEKVMSAGSHARMTVTPSFAWMMNKIIGIHWDVLSCKIVTLSILKRPKRILFSDENVEREIVDDEERLSSRMLFLD
jgi:hypothetical protein